MRNDPYKNSLNSLTLLHALIFSFEANPDYLSRLFEFFNSKMFFIFPKNKN